MNDIRQATCTYDELEAYLASVARGEAARQPDTLEILWWDPEEERVRRRRREQDAAGIGPTEDGHPVGMFQSLLDWLWQQAGGAS